MDLGWTGCHVMDLGRVCDGLRMVGQEDVM